MPSPLRRHPALAAIMHEARRAAAFSRIGAREGSSVVVGTPTSPGSCCPQLHKMSEKYNKRNFKPINVTLRKLKMRKF